jgi:hypothetical protein
LVKNEFASKNTRKREGVDAWHNKVLIIDIHILHFINKKHQYQHDMKRHHVHK